MDSMNWVGRSALDVLSLSFLGGTAVAHPHAHQRRVMIKAEELDLSRCHVRGTEGVERAARLTPIAVRQAVNEHFDAAAGPTAQTALKVPAVRKWRTLPMIGNVEHRKTRTAEAACKLVEKGFNLGRKTRPDVVDRRKQTFRDARPHDG